MKPVIAMIAAALLAIAVLILSAAFAAIGAYDLTRSALTYNEGWTLAGAYIVMTASCLWTASSVLGWGLDRVTITVEGVDAQ